MQGGTQQQQSSLRKLRRDWWKTRLCTSCVSPLGRIISRGGICPQCGLRVCKNCRSELEPETGAWVCVLCSNNGMTSDILENSTKSLGRDSRSIRRSWTISNPQRAQTNSPILKSYTILHPEEVGDSKTSLNNNSGSSTTINSKSVSSSGGAPAAHRQFHSLPRMTSDFERSKKIKRSFNSAEFEKENIKRHRSFQTTLHPYQVPNLPSPSASINFIEDPFWDYYDYDIDNPSESPKPAANLRLHQLRNNEILRRSSTRRAALEMEKILNIRTNSNRSSCERSLGESVDYDFSLRTNYNFNSLSDPELNENSKYEEPNEDLLTPRRYSTESTNFYRFATVTPINMSPLNDSRRANNATNLQLSSPLKPERKSKTKRSMSLNSYDTKKLFSPLRTYCLLMKENAVPKTNKIIESGNRFNDSPNASSKNTSSTLLNPSATASIGHIRTNGISDAQSTSGLSGNGNNKFHSLPRERVIRIEREDWKFGQAGIKTLNCASNGSSLDRNNEDKSRIRKTSVVEISRSPSYTTISVPVNGANNVKIQRSQSHREISSYQPEASVGNRINVTLEKNCNPAQAKFQAATLPISRSKVSKNEYDSSNKKDENQRNSSDYSKDRYVDRKRFMDNSVYREDNRMANDFVDKNKRDFENFQNQQIKSFDNYLRDCSTFPRASSAAREQRRQINGFDSEPKHISKTAIVNISSISDHEDVHSHGERVVPIQFLDVHDMKNKQNYAAGSNAFATLPHPYIRKHKQQAAEFEKDVSPTIIDIEREIERDIYFQKTKSLDRVRSSKPKPAVYILGQEPSPESKVPVASPRMKRKGKLASNPNCYAPKINTEPSSDYVTEFGTNYPQFKVSPHAPYPYQNNSSLPTKSVQGRSRDHQDHLISSFGTSNNSKLPTSDRSFSTDDSQGNTSAVGLGLSQDKMKIGSNSSGGEFIDSKGSLEPKSTAPALVSALKPTISNEQNFSSGLTASDQAANQEEQGLPPVATPRTRRKNSNHNHNVDNEQERAAGNRNNNNTIPSQSTIAGDASKSQSNLKAVRFEPHVIEMEIENERKHNKAKANHANVMRVNNKLRHHLVTSSHLPVSSSTNDQNIHSYSKHQNRNNKGNIQYISGTSIFRKNHLGSLKASSDKKHRSQAYGFVARAIAKVKGKARGKSTRSASGGAPITHTNLTGGIHSVETRDSITYISPPPTQQQEITPISLSLTQSSNGSFSQVNLYQPTKVNNEVQEKKQTNNLQESQSSIHPTESSNSKVDQELPTASQEYPPPPRKLNTTSVKPKKAMNPPQSKDILGDTIQFKNAEEEQIGDEREANGNYLGLHSDQFSPSSSSASSSSSYMSNLQESYDFFHESEECESISGEVLVDESDDHEAVFKSFEDDEDAGEDFVFYTHQDTNSDEKKGKKTSHAYNGPANLHATNIKNCRSIESSGNSSNGMQRSSTKGISSESPLRHEQTTLPLDHEQDYNKKDEKDTERQKELRKGLAKKQVEKNRKDAHPIPYLPVEALGVDFNSSPPPVPSRRKSNFSEEHVSTTSRLSDLTHKGAVYQQHEEAYEFYEKDNSHKIKHQEYYDGIAAIAATSHSLPRAKTSSRNLNEEREYHTTDDHECARDLGGQSQSKEVVGAQYGTNTQLPSDVSSISSNNNLNWNPASSYEEEQGNFLNPKFKFPKPNNLLLPSTFFKRSAQTKNNNFSQSEFFPGDISPGLNVTGGMSMCEESPNGNDYQDKFKSKVLVNSSENSIQTKTYSSGKIANKSPNSATGKKNITRVEISGDVGIVTTDASAFLNSRRALLKKTNEKLWENDVYSSGLSQLSSESLEQDNNSPNADNYYNENNSPNECLNTTVSGSQEADIDLIGSLDNEVGSSISNNGSGDSVGGSSSTDCKIGSSGSDDGSDWHSESTKNTVIFRGDPNCPPNSGRKQWHPSHTVGAKHEEVFNYNCDPEIHISSITLVDNEVTGCSSNVTPNFQDSSNVLVLTEAAVANHSSELANDSYNEEGKYASKNDNSLVSIESSGVGIQKGSQDVSNISSSCGLEDFTNELSKSNETLTDFDQDQSTIPEDLEDFSKIQSQSELSKSMTRQITNDGKSTTSFHQRRESPEGQEQEVPSNHPEKDSIISEPKTSDKKALALNEVIIMEDKSCKRSSGSSAKISKSKISQSVLSQITTSNRSSPDGADAERSDEVDTEPDGDSPTPMVEHFDVTSDDDSWVEEMIFEDDDDPSDIRKQQNPPLDRTLHTIVEESCEESEAENSGNFNQPSSSQRRRGTRSQQNDNELEKYFQFVTNNENQSYEGSNSLTNEESEFSDTFSESSCSINEDELGGERLLRVEDETIDPAELASSRLEKYFYNLGLPQSMINPISSINQTADSDSVGSESESDNSVLENRKKVLKHHRRSADFEDEFGDKVSDEEEDFTFGQDGFDTIKKTARKVKKSGSENNLLESSTGGSNKSSENLSSSTAGPESSSVPIIKEKASLQKSTSNTSSKDESSSASPTSPGLSRKVGNGSEKPLIKVNRSNSFTWSSDEEVNIMMFKLRQLIKNLIKSKTEANAAEQNASGATTSSSTGLQKAKDKQLVYLENELIRLMKSENLKNIVEYFSSEESDVDDVYKFIKVVKESGTRDDSSLDDFDLEDPHLLETLQTTMQADSSSHISPKGSPALLAKVMHHIGNRLAVWMKDENLQEDDNNDDSVTLKCAQSVSSDLNEDRYSWKGSFESTLAAKRQSVGSTDSISSSDFNQDRSILRSSSLHHLANSSHHLGQVEENKEEEETASSLPRRTSLCNSLPRLNQDESSNPSAISRAHSLVISGKSEGEPGPIKSARYRPPGFKPGKSKRADNDSKPNSILSQSTPVLTQDPDNLKARSDSMGSIFHDTKAHVPVRGQVEFGLQYNYKLACLEVRVKQCRDLAAVDNKRNRSDPYVKAYLLPDRSKGGKRKTKIKKNTLNPIFDEVLKFPLTLSDLQNRTLWLSVWNSDTFGKNEFLGEVLVDLKDRVFDDPNAQSWDLQEMSGETEDLPRGDVVIALKWQPKTENTGNLSVLVKEAKNLAPVKNGSPSTFIKCTTLADKSRKQKTTICRRSYNPVWNQTLNFEEVEDDGVEITLWNHDILSNHDLLGTVRVEYDNPLWGSMLSRHSFWVEGVLRLS